MGISIVDHATGTTAQVAILEALLARSRSGEGCDIHVSMFDVMADWLTVPLLHQDGGKPPKRVALAHAQIAPYGVFTTKDGKQVLISIQSDREWIKLSTDFIRAPAAGRDERFATNVARVQNRADTDALVTAAFANLTQVEAVDLLTKANIAFASVNDMEALASHPHLQRISVETEAGLAAFPAPGAVFSGPARTYGPVPALGADG